MAWCKFAFSQPLLYYSNSCRCTWKGGTFED